MNNLINAIIGNEPLIFKSGIEAMLNSKLKDRLDSEKVHLASTLFDKEPESNEEQ